MNKSITTLNFRSDDVMSRLYGGFGLSACVILLFLSATSAVVFAQAAARPSQASEAASAQPSPASDPEQQRLETEKLRLEREKLQLETDKLRIENANSVRELNTRRGWLNLVFANVTLLTTVLVGAWGLYRYFEKRSAELRSREEERFEGVVKSLGSEHAEERISASVLLPTFLSPRYARFHEQVFNLAAGHLRAETHDPMGSPNVTKLEFPANVSKMEVTMGPSTYSASATTPSAENDVPESAEITSNRQLISPRTTTPMPSSLSPLAQALANVFGKSYRLSRDAAKRKAEGDRTVLARQLLNASGVRLDGTYLANIDLKSAWLRQASLSGTTLNSALLRNAVLEGSNMSHALLIEAELVDANLKNVDFSGADLTDAVLDGANLDGANFKNAHLNKVTMIRGTTAGVDFSGADLTDARFEGVDFSSADFPVGSSNLERAASLKDAAFKGVRGLSDEQISRCTAKGATFLGESRTHVGTDDSSSESIESRIEELVRRLKYYSSTQDRVDAANELALLGAPAEIAVREICGLLRKDRADRLVAAYAIERLGERAKDGVPDLVQALKYPDETLRMGVANALGGIGVSAVPELVEALKDVDPGVRSSAAYALGKIGERATDAVFHLIGALADADAAVRKSAASALGKIGRGAKAAVPHLIQVLKDPDEDTQSAADALGEIGKDAKDAVPQLILALKDEDVDVRRSAANALGSIGEYAKAAVPHLIEAFRDPDDEARYYAANALGKIGKAAFPQLMEALKDRDEDVRMSAADALGSIKEKEKT